MSLLQQLSAAESFSASRFELAHVLAITLDLFLLGVNTASIKGSSEAHRLSSEGWTRGEGLCVVGIEEDERKT